jgi:hypothetical protein
MCATPFLLSQLFTDLTGRRVSVVDAAELMPSTAAKAYGIYEVVPGNAILLLKVDLPLLASLGGVLVGLPESIVKQQISQQPLDETLRDAMHEVLNITSKVLTKHGRAVLREMITDKTSGDAFTTEFIQQPHAQRRFYTTMNGYPAGEITLFTAI